jgi:hypothetical protein
VLVLQQQLTYPDGQLLVLSHLLPAHVSQPHQLRAHQNQFVLQLPIHLVSLGVHLEAAQPLFQKFLLPLQILVGLLETHILVL